MPRISGPNPQTPKHPGGRPESPVNPVTRRLLHQAVREDKIPLAVMLDNMMFYHEQSLSLTAKCVELAEQLTPDCIQDGAEILKDFFKFMREMIAFRDKAQGCAVDAAPYMHPKLASIALSKALPADPVPDVKRLMKPKEASLAYAATLSEDRQDDVVARAG